MPSKTGHSTSQPYAFKPGLPGLKTRNAPIWEFEENGEKRFSFDNSPILALASPDGENLFEGLMKTILESIPRRFAHLFASKLRTTISAIISGLIAGIFFFWGLSLALKDLDPQFGLQIFFLIVYSSTIFTACFIFISSLLYIPYYFASGRSDHSSTPKLVLSFVLLAAISYISYSVLRWYIPWSSNIRASVSNSTSSATLEALYQKALSPYDYRIMMNLADNHASSPDLLAKLSKVQDTSVRSRVARNPNASLEIIEQLAADPDPFVRASTAGNSKVTDEIILKLCDDEHERVRTSAAYFAKQRGLK